MRTYHIAQRTLLNALCSPKWREILKRVDTCIHTADSVCVQQKLTQHLKQLHSNKIKFKKPAKNKHETSARAWCTGKTQRD